MGSQISEESPNTNIVLSSIILRTDNPKLAAKAAEANKFINSLCSKNKWKFINHSSINSSCLNSRGLHLNRKGTSYVAKNLSQFITSKEDFASRESVNYSPSKHSHIHSLQHILSKRGLVIACLNINSLVAHIDQLRIFLGLHKIDILAINETKLDPTITSNEIPGPLLTYKLGGGNKKIQITHR